ncbi:hypothetical protein ACQKJG_18340 [Priestia megaterium]|uniref:hypothetical protein n=1 Tax=Priestia megaterium TaxID=1404 RepID=UPI003CFD739C
MDGLVKVAFDYSNDPGLKAYNDHYAEKEKAFEEAKAQRNPELVAKEERAMNMGAGIGAGTGGLGGIVTGGIIGAGEGKTLAGKAAYSVGGGLLGGLLGAGAGAAVGGLASLPAVYHHRGKEDPEVMENYYKTNGELLDAEMARELAEEDIRKRYELRRDR